MKGYGPDTYGEGMAEVYDDWYGDFGDAAVAAATLVRLAGPGPVLELGVGTGRVADPMAEAGLEIHGIDASPAMLERLASRCPKVHRHLGDMSAALPGGPYSLVFAAINTLFNLDTEDAQRRCLANVAAALSPDGRFVVQAFVPDVSPIPYSKVELRSMTAEAVVLTVSTTDPEEQTSGGHFVELRDGEPVRLRPWRVRWASPSQIDEMATSAGLVLDDRWERWDGSPFGSDSTHHVSIYRRV
ncbi:MAG TPA: class I SAM-dependent methyltransferase [Acidimicrobiales bacterium]